MEDGAKGGLLQSVVSFIKDIPEFKLCTRMCDFAGSTGYYSLALMDKSRKLKSCVYDLPEVCKIAEELREKEINRGRITSHSGNYHFNTNPAYQGFWVKATESRQTELYQQHFL